MFKASELVAFCKSMIGMPYWYGTCGYNCTESLLKRKAKQYPSHYGASRMSKYRDAINKKLVCMDCIGMIKAFFWTNGGSGVKEAIGTGREVPNKYASNGFPDKSANGMLSYCKSKKAKNGKISSLPEVPGVLLFSPGHVGVYVGNGYAVEARGFNYGVVQTRVASRKWTSWAYIPDSLLEYDTDGKGSSGQSSFSGEKTEREYKLGERLIKKGVRGADVAELQKVLIQLGYDLGKYGADGECGSKTVEAIKAFQKDNGLSVDGEYGAKSHAKMQKVLASADSSGGASSFEICVTGKTVNVRNQPNSSTGKVVRVVRLGDKLKAVSVDKATGWYKLEDGNYISNKYAKVVS